jgi:two-component system OmpR family sensor kinase
MRSLRGRLVAILLLVATAGMIVLAAVTFAEQRSFLYDRLDRQVQSAAEAVVGALQFEAQLAPNNSGSGSGSSLGDDDDLGPGRFDDNGNGGGPAPAGGPGLNLPPGTYGAVLDSSGNVVQSRIFAYREGNYALPDFSDSDLTSEPQTIGSKGDDDTEFRAASRTLLSGRTVVVAVPMSETTQTLHRLVLVEAIVIGGVLLLLGVASWLLVGIGLRPLDRMGETADAIAGGDLTRRVEPADERSEIGRLGLALNRMLHSLERAFGEREASEGRLRQFLADASHELRTPLVSIRGYAELYRLGATRDEDEVKKSMARIEQEAERMGLLVEDMLTLARLDETHESNFIAVDLTNVLTDAVRDAEVSAPGRSISLDAGGPVIVNGDAHQLLQVAANLLRNAVVHTPEDTPIEVTLVRNGGEAQIDFRDHGPGLPAGAGDKLFERFWRSETGRERGKAGSGLGLSIVHGIVEAHGGRVHAQNADDGDGAQFTVWLPLPNQAA